MAKTLRKANARRNARRVACEEMRANASRLKPGADVVKAYRMPGSMKK